MKQKLQELSLRVERVAKVASELAESGADDHSALLEAIMTYRAAVVTYIGSSVNQQLRS